MNNFRDDCDKQKAIGTISIRTLLTEAAFVKPFAVIMVLMFFQQFGGINVVMFYSQEIFADAGSDMDPGDLKKNKKKPAAWKQDVPTFFLYYCYAY